MNKVGRGKEGKEVNKRRCKERESQKRRYKILWMCQRKQKNENEYYVKKIGQKNETDK